MINLEEVRSISDRYIFMINNERISVNKDDIKEIHNRSVIRATEYKALMRDINTIKCDYLSKMEYHRKMVDEFREKWEKSKHIRYSWAADDHSDRIKEFGCCFDGVKRVWEMVNDLVKKYEGFAIITQRIINNEGW